MKQNHKDLELFFINLVKENKARHIVINENLSVVIYKGFKIEKEYNLETSQTVYTMSDLRFTDITNCVKQHEFNRMIEQGVVKAIDLISSSYNKTLIEGLTDQLNNYEKLLVEDNDIDKNYIMSKIDDLTNEISSKENAIIRINKLYKNGK